MSKVNDTKWSYLNCLEMWLKDQITGFVVNNV